MGTVPKRVAGVELLHCYNPVGCCSSAVHPLIGVDRRVVFHSNSGVTMYIVDSISHRLP